MPPGKEASEKWQPYKLWAADLWECLGCGHELISGYGQHPLSIHHMPDFKDQVATVKTFHRLVGEINDC